MERRTPLKRTRMPARTKPMPRNASPVKTRRQKNTGPSQKTRDLVDVRAGGMCEWPACPQIRAEVQHRLGRKSGGRHGQMRLRLNRPAWLLACCSDHHRGVTSKAGPARRLAVDTGWLLEEFRDGLPVDARTVPVLTRHDARPVLLDDAGGWTVSTC